MKQLKGFLKSSLFLILLSSLGRADVPVQDYKIRSLKIKGTITSVTAQDFNGNGCIDLMIVTDCKDLVPCRNFNVFFNHPVISDVPDLVVQADKKDVFFTTKDMERHGGRELITLGTGGISILSLGEKTQTISKKHLTLCTSFRPDQENLMKYDFTADIDGDSIAEIFVPSTGRIDIFKKEASGNYKSWWTLITEPEISILKKEIISYQVSIPEIKIGNIAGDSRSDVVLKYKDKIEIFHAKRFYGSLSDNTVLKHDTVISFNLINPSVPAEDSKRQQSSLILIDLNNDGLLDVVNKRVVKTPTLEHVIEVYVYMNHGGTLSFEPDNIFVSESFNGEMTIQDFNSDGLLDFAVFKIRLDLSQVPSYIFKKKLLTSFDIYLMHTSGRYSDSPESAASLKVDILPEDIPAFQPCYSFDGDFNNDGYKDLVAETGRDRFSIFLNKKNGKFSSSPNYSFIAPSCRNILIIDVNNDGMDDMVLWDRNHVSLVQSIRRKSN